MEVRNGMLNVHTIYAIDDVNNGVEVCYISREKCIEAIKQRYNKDVLPYMNDRQMRDGSIYTVPEQIKDDMDCLTNNGYIDDCYYILEIDLL